MPEDSPADALREIPRLLTLVLHVMYIAHSIDSFQANTCNNRHKQFGVGRDQLRFAAPSLFLGNATPRFVASDLELIDQGTRKKITMDMNTTVSHAVPHRSVRVVVADHNLMSAQLLAQTLKQDRQFHVTVVSSSAQLIAAGGHADVAVISIDFAGAVEETMRITRTLNDRYPNARLIVLMDKSHREIVVDAFRYGAKGVFPRTRPLADFLKCVDSVSQGDIWASRTEIEYLLSALRRTPGSRMIGSQDIRVLTKRELEVVRQAGEGLHNREIAEKLGLSEHTVKNYIFRIFEKIGVSSRVELLFYLLGQERVPPVDGLSRDRVEQQNDASSWHRAAQDGFPTAQLALGLAHQRGEGAEKNELSAYYWLRRAERNAQEILSETRRALEDVKRSLDANALDEVERSLQSPDSHTVHTSGMFAVPPHKGDSVGRKAG